MLQPLLYAGVCAANIYAYNNLSLRVARNAAFLHSVLHVAELTLKSWHTPVGLALSVFTPLIARKLKRMYPERFYGWEGCADALLSISYTAVAVYDVAVNGLFGIAGAHLALSVYSLVKFSMIDSSRFFFPYSQDQRFRAYLEAKEFDKASEYAEEKMDGELGWENVLNVEIVRACLKDNDFDRAVDYAGKLEGQDRKDKANLAIVKAYLEVKQLDKAVDYAAKLEGQDWKDMAKQLLIAQDVEARA